MSADAHSYALSPEPNLSETAIGAVCELRLGDAHERSLARSEEAAEDKPEESNVWLMWPRTVLDAVSAARLPLLSHPQRTEVVAMKGQLPFNSLGAAKLALWSIQRWLESAELWEDVLCPCNLGQTILVLDLRWLGLSAEQERRIRAAVEMMCPFCDGDGSRIDGKALPVGDERKFLHLCGHYLDMMRRDFRNSFSCEWVLTVAEAAVDRMKSDLNFLPLDVHQVKYIYRAMHKADSGETDLSGA